MRIAGLPPGVPCGVPRGISGREPDRFTQWKADVNRRRIWAIRAPFDMGCGQYARSAKAVSSAAMDAATPDQRPHRGMRAALVLASGSPRRAEMLRAAGFEPEIEPADIDDSALVPGAVEGAAFATSLASARVGRGCSIIDSSICVAVITGRP